MRFVLIFLLSTLSHQVAAADYESAVPLEDGDVISADVMNDILERIELTLKPVAADELNGNWTVEQYFCSDEGEYGSETQCNYNDSRALAGTTLDAGLILKRSDTVVISSNSDGTINWTSTNYDVLFNFNETDAMEQNTGGLTHVCKIYPTNLIACLLDDSITNNNRRLTTYMKTRRTSSDQFILSFGPDLGDGLINFLILDKSEVPPAAPASLSVSSSSGSNMLSWTAGDDTATSYRIMSKDAASGDFSELGTATGTNFIDASPSASRQYRVFAINDNGTSIGSNVVSLD